MHSSSKQSPNRKAIETLNSDSQGFKFYVRKLQAVRDHIILVNDIPKTTNQKILEKELGRPVLDHSEVSNVLKQNASEGNGMIGAERGKLRC